MNAVEFVNAIRDDLKARKPAPPLWPDKFLTLDGDTAFKFVTQCWWTYDEAEQQVALIPAKEYLEEIVHEWVGCFNARRPLIIEKSRRIVVSNTCRGLEAWLMGVNRGDGVIVDQKHENSAKHLWRMGFSLQELHKRNPQVLREKCEMRGAVQVKQATHLIFPNGSVVTQAHQDAEGEQGTGSTFVTLEELSKYKNPQGYLAQALMVTMGKAGSEGKGGWVMGIANATPNTEWALCKNGIVAREALGFE